MDLGISGGGYEEGIYRGTPVPDPGVSGDGNGKGICGGAPVLDPTGVGSTLAEAVAMRPSIVVSGAGAVA